MSIHIEAPNTTLTPTQKEILFTLMLADNANVHSHRLGEWCGHGPVIEQDIALTNIALDHLGGARSLYQYAATLFNGMNKADKLATFSSPLLHQKVEASQDLTEDDLCFLRDAWDYRNVLLTELPNTDFGYTVARCFFLDAFNFSLYETLSKHANPTWSAIATKSLKEVGYHLKWSSEWMIRLGDGTAESHERIQEAVNQLWPYTGELFSLDEVLTHAGLKDEMPTIQKNWQDRMAKVMDEATLTIPTTTWAQHGGKAGSHTEHLGYILADMQFMQRAYPGLDW